MGPGSPPEGRLKPRVSLQALPCFQGNETPASPNTCCPAKKGTRRDPGQQAIRQSRDRCEGRPPDAGEGHPRPSPASPGESGAGGGRLGLQAGDSWGEWGERLPTGDHPERTLAALAESLGEREGRTHRTKQTHRKSQLTPRKRQGRAQKDTPPSAEPGRAGDEQVLPRPPFDSESVPRHRGVRRRAG